MGGGAQVGRPGERVPPVAAVIADRSREATPAPEVPRLEPRAQAGELAATAPRRDAAIQPLYQRALLLWPGIDRALLSRTHGDPRKVARIVARRTIHSEETILSLLQGERAGLQGG
jgi:hypothetical protein